MSVFEARAALERTYRTERRRVLATLIRLLGSFDAAEEAVAEAFAAAAASWEKDGMPANPVSWLISAGRFRTIDRWRKNARLEGAIPDLLTLSKDMDEMPEPAEDLADDELRLIFTCCHPAVAPDARIALTLREVAGLTTEEIARAYLTPTPTIAQRIVRAKTRIRELGLPYEVPDRAELPRRTESVLRVIYLVFNESHMATEGPALTRADLGTEAIRLARLLHELIPQDPEIGGLLALMLLHEARRATRTSADGEIVLLEDQDRGRWDWSMIAEAERLIARAVARRRLGPFLIQAMIASIHATAPRFAETDWAEIAALYRTLMLADPSPVAALNHAVAIGMRDGPQAGLDGIDAAMAEGGLANYHPAHLARADMLRRLGRTAEARESYARALALTRLSAERRFLERRLAEIPS